MNLTRPLVLRFALAVVAVILFVSIATFFLTVLREALVVGVATVLRWSVEAKIINPLVESLVVSSVHRSRILAGLDVHPEGIAVAGFWGGELFHRLLPSFFLEPREAVPGTWVSAVFNKDHTAVFGVFVTQTITAIILLASGSMLMRLGLRAGSLFALARNRRFPQTYLVAAGLFIVAQTVWAVWNIFDFISLQDTGVGLFVTQVLGINDARTYNFTVNEFLPWAVPAGIIAVGLGFLPALDVLGRLVKRLFSGTRIAFGETKWRNYFAYASILFGLFFMLLLSMLFPANSFTRQNNKDAKTGMLPVPETIALAPIPLGTPPSASGLLNPQTPAAPVSRGTSVNTTSTPRPISLLPSTVAIQPLPGRPKRTEIRYSPAGRGFVLTFNGVRRKMRAVNYNVDYTRVPEPEQVEHYRQDFDIIRRAGFNTVTGYGIFNEVMLRVAEEKGIHVVMPFDLDPTKDYIGDTYRKQMLQEFVAFLDRIRVYPSVAMINVGGDELATQMEIKHPSPLEYKERYLEIQAAVNFEFELAELAYQRTSLPTLLKEHGEFFLPYTETATLNARAQGKAPEKYITVGIDIYGRPAEVASRLKTIIIPWVAGKLRLPMMVSEFAPYGGPFKERPQDYRKILSELRAAVAKYQIVGYGAYCLFMDEARPENRLVNDFGLLDSKRNPVDGSIAAMASVLEPSLQLEQELEIKQHPFFEIYPSFQPVVEQIGGYPTSGMIERDVDGHRVIEQHFAEGNREGRTIAYTLVQRGNASIETQEVRQVIFNLLGDYVLEIAMLEAYMSSGGYAKFGAPVSNAYSSVWNNKRGTRQDFAKGYALFTEEGAARPTTIPTRYGSLDFGQKD